MALGRGARDDGSPTTAIAAFERAAALVPHGHGRRQPARADRRDRAGARATRRARDRGARGADRRTTSPTSRRRAQLVDAARRARNDAGAAAGRARRAIVGDRSVRRRRARARSAASRSTRGRSADARRGVPGGARRSSRSIGPARTPIWPRATSKAGQRAEAKQADAGGARDRAELRARAGPAAEAGRRTAAECAAPCDGRRRRRVLAWRVALARRSPRLAARRWRAAAGAVGRPLRRPAVDASSASSTAHEPTKATADRAQDFWDEPWVIDAPAAEQNLSRRVKTATAIEVGDPIVLTLDDPRLLQYPWIYFVEPGNLKLQRQRRADPARVPAARRHRSRSTTSTARSSGSTSAAR